MKGKAGWHDRQLQMFVVLSLSNSNNTPDPSKNGENSRYGKDEDERKSWLKQPLTQMFLVAYRPNLYRSNSMDTPDPGKPAKMW